VIKDGKVMFANTCPAIEDNICQEHVCLSDGSCARRTVAGSECSMTEQCEESFGPGYVCNITLCTCEVMVPVNGSMYTNSLVCDNNGTMSVVMVMDAMCPTTGQVLTAIDSSSASWQDVTMASAGELECATGTVVVSNATCPTTGQVLTATTSGIAEWQDVEMASASELECATGTVIVSNSTCPTTGQVLTATSSGTAEWSSVSTSVTTETVVGFDPNDQATPMSIGVDVTFVDGGVHAGGAAQLALTAGSVGQSYIVTMTVVGTSGAVATDGANIDLAGISTITFAAVGDSVHLLYNGAAWAVIGSYGVVIA
jgi:hypothetical protein